MKPSHRPITSIAAACLAAPLLVALTLLAATPAAAQDTPSFFKHGCWVCVSQEAYGEALTAQSNLGGKTFGELRKELWDAQQCIYIEDDQVTDVVAPYIKVLDVAGDMRRVSFVLKLDKRLSIIHHEMEWLKFNGWTDADNLKLLW